MILKVREKNGSETDYYLNENKTNISICIDDLAKLYTYVINVLNGKRKLLSLITTITKSNLNESQLKKLEDNL